MQTYFDIVTLILCSLSVAVTMETSQAEIQMLATDVAMDMTIKPEVTTTISKQIKQTTQVMPQVTTVSVEGVATKPEDKQPETAQPQEVTSVVKAGKTESKPETQIEIQQSVMKTEQVVKTTSETRTDTVTGEAVTAVTSHVEVAARKPTQITEDQLQLQPEQVEEELKQPVASDVAPVEVARKTSLAHEEAKPAAKTAEQEATAFLLPEHLGGCAMEWTH